jgi:hypothetical protein
MTLEQFDYNYERTLWGTIVELSIIGGDVNEDKDHRKIKRRSDSITLNNTVKKVFKISLSASNRKWFSKVLETNSSNL